MSDAQLTALSTLLWIVATVSLFILLANWSAGASWGISAGIVNGVRGWAQGRGLLARTPSSAGELPPLALPPTERPAIGWAGTGRLEASAAGGPAAEIEELPARRI